MTITLTPDLTVELIQSSGNDTVLAAAAKVSTSGDIDLSEVDTDSLPGFLGYLMRFRHGSPFEHGQMTFRVHAPIFVFRELFRHRIASYNEESARYKTMDPVFYTYPPERPLVQQGSGAHPDLVEGTPELTALVNDEIERASRVAWDAYQRMLAAGAAREVARSVLPVGLFSSAWVTMNPRALMNFLSLRVDGGGTYVTKPQWEIEQVARRIEALFAEQYPVTHAVFVKHGRVAP